MSPHDSYYAPNSTSPPPTPDERDRIPQIATEVYGWLWKQDNRCAELADFIAELREYDIRSVLVDAILGWMTGNNWVMIWRKRREEEFWISIVDEQGDGDDDEGE